MSKILPVLAALFFTAIFAFAGHAQTADGAVKDNEVKQQKQEKEKNGEDRDCPESATVRIRAVFDKSGKVTKAETVLSGGCEYFDRKAMKAVRKIKFEPAMKNGKKISVTKLVEYTFKKY